MNPNSASTILWILWSLIMPLSFLSSSPMMLEWSILQISASPIIIPIILDQTSILFASAVLFISANVMQFSKTYMMSDKSISRFIYLVMLFVLSMNLLIFIPHLITLLIGWDGLGLVSFLLVIYYQNPKSLGAGMITVLSNRIGDALILLSIGWMLNQGHWSIMSMWYNNMDATIAALIMLAAMTKSAQLPFSSWLPAAMAAPTPVSALVHSSTLVTAGVFLLIRFSPFLMKWTYFQPSLLLLASMTMLMAGYSAMGECDMKKIIALSTLSQLGVMMASLAMGSKTLALFHLLTHAMFKALLFICAGMIIHNHAHSQDLRLMGNIQLQMPTTTSCLMIANLALCGSPFLSGFYSKDLIIEFTLFNPNNIIIILMFIIATTLTTSYSLRFMLAIMWSPTQSQPTQYTSNSNSDYALSTILLSLNAIFLGCMLNWSMMSPINHPILPTPMKCLTLVLCILSVFIVWSLHTHTSLTSSYLMSVKAFHLNMTSMWQMTPISTQKIPLSILSISNATTKHSDMGWIEMIGPQGFHLKSTKSAQYISLLQSIPFSYMALSLFLSLILLIILI